MRRLFFIAVLIAEVMLGSVYAQGGFKLIGSIQGLEDGKTVTLSLGATHRDEKPIYRAVMTNGIFTVEGNLEEPRLFYLSVVGYKGVAPIFLENANITVSAKYSLNEEWASFSNIQVEGSESHDFFQVNAIDVRERFDKLYAAYHERSKEILELMSKFKRGSEEYEKLEKSDAYKKFEKDEHDFFIEVGEKYAQIIKENANTFWGPFFMLQFYSYLTEAEKPFYEMFSAEAKSSFYGKIVKSNVIPEIFLGKVAPNFIEVDRDGKNVSLSESLGEYTIIDFWASWCAPCRKEIPNLKKIYERYHSKGLSIIGVSIDKEDAKWLKALDEEKLPWINLLNKNDAANAYNVKAVPSMFVIDKNGMVIGENLKGDSLEQKIRELFGE